MADIAARIALGLQGGIPARETVAGSVRRGADQKIAVAPADIVTI